MLGVVGGMKMGKLLEHTNCIVWLLCLDYEFESTLPSLKFTLEDGISQKLNTITKENELSWFQLDLKKKTRHYPFYTSHSMLKTWHLHNIQ